jgi:FixJ family two-component response regulator
VWSGFRAGKGQEPLTDASVISVVDDDQNMRLAIVNLLQSLGHHVHSFASAEAFLRSPHANDTACLITDIAMPGFSGLELQRHLNDQGNHISIIFITAYFDPSTKRRALNAGAVGFLSKPFDSEALIECLAEALRRHRDRAPEK